MGGRVTGTGALVLGGSASLGLARSIAKRLGAAYKETRVRTFPDGETKITLPGRISAHRRVIVVQSVAPPAAENLLELLLLLSKAQEISAEVTAVVPYMGYARQDREFLAGEVVTLKVVSGIMRAAGARSTIVVDIHSRMGLECLGRGARSVSAVPALAGYISGLRLKKPLAVSPDAGGAARAAEFASILGIDSVALAKRRDRRTGSVSIASRSMGNVRGRDIIIVDDMISTGGSIVKAATFLKKQKCGRVLTVCTHALLVGGARAKIKKAGVSRIISANTISGSTSVVDVSGVIADALA